MILIYYIQNIVNLAGSAYFETTWLKQSEKDLFSRKRKKKNNKEKKTANFVYKHIDFVQVYCVLQVIFIVCGNIILKSHCTHHLLVIARKKTVYFCEFYAIFAT